MLTHAKFRCSVFCLGLLAFVQPGFASESGLLCTEAIQISGVGIESFVLDPAFLDGPQRGPTNNLGDIFSGPTTFGWGNYGVGGIQGTYQFGDLFGINMSFVPFHEGGDAWLQYTAICTGTAWFDVNPLGEGTLTDSQLEAYPGDVCPTDWKQIIAWDEDGGPGFQASMSVAVEAGESYFVRIGGWLGESGTGIVHYSCDHGPDVDVQDSLSLKKKGKIPVHVFGSESFDVTQVEASSVFFGPGAATPAHRNGPHANEDENSDGFLDLTAHFRADEIGIEECDQCSTACKGGDVCLTNEPGSFGCSCKSTLELCIWGTNTDGTTFSGCDPVRIRSK